MTTAIEDVFTALRTALAAQSINTALADLAADAGEHEPALHDLCYTAVQHTATVPAELAGTVTAWLNEAGYPELSTQFGALETASHN